MPTSKQHATPPALVLFAHGSRDPEWVRPFLRIRDAVRVRQPGTQVELAFLEIMEPALDIAVDKLVESGCASISVAPLFMAQGAHLKRDLTRILDAIRIEHPKTSIALLPAIGETEAITNAIADWLVVQNIH